MEDSEYFGIDPSDDVTNNDPDPRQRTPVKKYEFDWDILQQYKGDFVAAAVLKHVQIQVEIKVNNAKNGKKVRDFSYHDSLDVIERLLGIPKSTLQRAVQTLSADYGRLIVKKLKSKDNRCSYALRNRDEFLASRADEAEYKKLKVERHVKEKHKLNWVEGCVLYNLSYWQDDINAVAHPDCLYRGKYWFYKKTCKICAGRLTPRQKKKALFSLEKKGLIERVPYYDGGGHGKGKRVKDQWWIHVKGHFQRVNKVNRKNHVCWTPEQEKHDADRIKSLKMNQLLSNDTLSRHEMGNPRPKMGNPRHEMGNPRPKVGNRNSDQTSVSEKVAEEPSRATQSSIYSSSLSVQVAPLPAHQKNLDSNLPQAGAADGDRPAASPAASPSGQPHSGVLRSISLSLVDSHQQQPSKEGEAKQAANTNSLPVSSQGGGATKAKKGTGSITQAKAERHTAAGERQSKQSRPRYQLQQPQAALTLEQVDQMHIPTLQETQIETAMKEAEEQRAAEKEYYRIIQEQDRQRCMVGGRPTGRKTGEAVDANGHPVTSNASGTNDLPVKPAATAPKAPKPSERSSKPSTTRALKTAYDIEMATDCKNVRLRYQEAYRAAFPDEVPDRLGKADDVYMCAQYLRIPVRVYAIVHMITWAESHPGRRYYSHYLVGDGALRAVDGWLEAAKKQMATCDESSVALIMERCHDGKIDWRYVPGERDEFILAVEKAAQDEFESDCDLSHDDYDHLLVYSDEREDWDVMIDEITKELRDEDVYTVAQAIRAVQGWPEQDKEMYLLHNKYTLCRKPKKAPRRKKPDPATASAGELLDWDDSQMAPTI
jgi:hypothetical protein